MSRKNSIAAVAMALTCASTCITSCGQKANDDVNGITKVNVNGTTTDLRTSNETVTETATEFTITTSSVTEKPTTTTTNYVYNCNWTVETTAYVAGSKPSAETTGNQTTEAQPEVQTTVSQTTEAQIVETTTTVTFNTVESVSMEGAPNDAKGVSSDQIIEYSYSSVEMRYSNNLYYVQAGDCRSVIAENNCCTEADLINANPGCDWDYIQPGQVIYIPTYVSAPSNEISSQTFTTYVVAEGDCLFNIAANYGITIDEIVNANPSYEFEWLMPGDVLTIPMVVTETEEPVVYDWGIAEEASVAEPTPIEIVTETEPVQEPAPVASTETEAVQVTETVDVTETTTVSETQPVTEATTSVTFEVMDVAEKTTTEVPVTDEPTSETEPVSVIANGEMPQSVMDEINRLKKLYPGIDIGMGIYSLDGKISVSYNEYDEYAAGCTVKAAYAMFVLQQCEEQGIEIDFETIEFKKEHINHGSGDIQFVNSPGQKLIISYLLRKLLSISDNTAYNILLSRFPLEDFQNFLWEIGGQNLYGCQYGIASVEQRRNEWFAIWDYIHAGRTYSRTLEDYITQTPYCYLCDGMADYHGYMHKSGWSDESHDYTCAADCAIIDNNYLVVVITQDYRTGTAHTDAVRSLGGAAEAYMASQGYY